MKKLLSLVLALVMVLALAAPVFAAEYEDVSNKEYTITIQNAKTTQTYKAWRVLDLATYDESLGAYLYTVSTKYPDLLTYTTTTAVAGETINIADYLELKNYTGETGSSASQYVVWKGTDDSDVQEFAKAALEYAQSVNADGDFVATAEGTEVTLKVTGAGYYVVNSTMGTLVSADTTNNSIVITEKNTEPSLTKKVQENSTGNYGEENNASIGDTVNFKITVTAYKGAENYVIHDKMSDGLDFTGVTKITATNKAGELVSGTDYTVTSADLTDECEFEIKFEKAYLDTVTAETTITVEYTARLNEKAVIDGANENEAKLTWGDDPSNATVPQITKTYTYDFGILKYGKNSADQDVALSGAHFELKQGDKVLYFAKDASTGVYQVKYNATETTEGVTKDLVSGADGRVKIEGLDAGTYTLTETKAPAGYNQLDTPVTIVIQGDGHAYTSEGDQWTNTKFVLEGQDPEADVVPVENLTGTELPSTGGIGTTIFYVVGGILVAAALILFVTKKRMSASEN